MSWEDKTVEQLVDEIKRVSRQYVYKKLKQYKDKPAIVAKIQLARHIVKSELDVLRCKEVLDNFKED